MRAQWENEKNAIGRVQQLREEIAGFEPSEGGCRAEFMIYDTSAAELKHGRLTEAQEQLAEEERRIQVTKEKNILS